MAFCPIFGQWSRQWTSKILYFKKSVAFPCLLWISNQSPSPAVKTFVNIGREANAAVYFDQISAIILYCVFRSRSNVKDRSSWKMSLAHMLRNAVHCIAHKAALLRCGLIKKNAESRWNICLLRWPILGREHETLLEPQSGELNIVRVT